MKTALLIIDLILTICGLLHANENNPQVIIPDGIVEGLSLPAYNGEKFYSFRGIPFAVPPINELRFSPAIKNHPWKDILNATAYGPFCTQLSNNNIVGVEDCLYLNVFTKSLNATNLLPVMFYIHGGGFHTGSSNIYGPEFLLTEDIVLVTFNYRLGLLAYLNMVNSHESDIEKHMASNNGHRDQLLALKWVNNNIKYFGGNPKAITICGESAGGMSVHAHLLSPLSRGLYQRASFMSGNSIMPIAIAMNNSALGIAKQLNIDTNNHGTMVHLLKQTPVQSIFKAGTVQKYFDVQLNHPVPFGLVKEPNSKHSFMPDFPLRLLDAGQYSKVPMLVGNTNKEGYLIYSMNQPNLKEMDTHIPFFFTDREEVAEKLLTYYGINATTFAQNVSFYTDAWFRYESVAIALEHAKHVELHYYEFAADTKLNFMKPTIPKVADLPGACHADELGYLFKFPTTPPIAKDSLEEELMLKMVKLWTDFVKGNSLPTKWKPLDDDLNILLISNKGVRADTIPRPWFHFWQNLYSHHGHGNF